MMEQSRSCERTHSKRCSNPRSFKPLGYKNNSVAGNNRGNSRNGTSPKRLKTSQGEIGNDVPRDRIGGYSPVVVGRCKRTLGELEDQIISRYAKGMVARKSLRRDHGIYTRFFTHSFGQYIILDKSDLQMKFTF